MLTEASHRLPDPPPSRLPDVLHEDVPRPQPPTSPQSWARWTFADVFYVGLAIVIWGGMLAGLVFITDDNASLSEQLLVFSTGSVGVFVATFISTLVIARRRGHRLPDLGFRPPSFVWIIAALVLGIVFVPIRIELADYVQTVFDVPTIRGTTPVNERFDPGILLIVALESLLMVVVLAPVVEELVFRGVLYGWMRGRFGIIPAILLNGFAFGLAHIEPLMILVNTILGWVLAASYEYSKSLWVAMLIHLTNNTLVIGVLVLEVSATL